MRAHRTKQRASSTPWLITFTDVMTLMLTFFVTLVAMSVFDERSRLIVLGSVTSVFGDESSRNYPWPTERKDDRNAPGHTEQRDDALINIRQLLLADNPEVRLSQNGLFLVLSINSDILFEPGGVAISPRGRALLDRFVPHLLDMKHPMRIAGHSSSGLEETGLNYSGPTVQGLEGAAVAGWAISMERALSVYRHFTARGVNPALLSMEGHGEYKPTFSNDTPDGRQKNRRVDLILDKRERLFAGSGETRRILEEQNRDYYFRDFHFDLDNAPPPSVPGLPPISGNGQPALGNESAGAPQDLLAGGVRLPASGVPVSAANGVPARRYLP